MIIIKEIEREVKLFTVSAFSKSMSELQTARFMRLHAHSMWLNVIKSFE